MNDQPLHEETLDPQDWDALKALGHQMVDDMLDYLATMRERPVWQPMPDEVKAQLPPAAAARAAGRGSRLRGFQARRAALQPWATSIRASGRG